MPTNRAWTFVGLLPTRTGCAVDNIGMLVPTLVKNYIDFKAVKIIFIELEETWHAACIICEA